MPELPEVETVRGGLAPVFEGAVITRVEQRRTDLRFPLPADFAARLTGQKVEHLTRRAKYLQAWLRDGEVLVMHLGMSGRFTVHPPAGLPAPPSANGTKADHDHIVFHLNNGHRIVYNDARRFGYMTLIAAASLEQHRFFARLGIEPLGEQLTPDFLAKAAARHKTNLKALLMNQNIIAGLGNIYVCEALHLAALSPRRTTACLRTPRGRPSTRARRLAEAIKLVLREAIAAGGSTLRDYARADGSLGYFQHRFQVYGREGEACRRPGCFGRIRRIAQNGRSTFYCPTCQR